MSLAGVEIGDMIEPIPVSTVFSLIDGVEGEGCDWVFCGTSVQHQITRPGLHLDSRASGNSCFCWT